MRVNIERMIVIITNILINAAVVYHVQQVSNTYILSPIASRLNNLSLGVYFVHFMFPLYHCFFLCFITTPC